MVCPQAHSRLISKVSLWHFIVLLCNIGIKGFMGVRKESFFLKTSVWFFYFDVGEVLSPKLLLKGRDSHPKYLSCWQKAMQIDIKCQLFFIFVGICLKEKK